MRKPVDCDLWRHNARNGCSLQQQCVWKQSRPMIRLDTSVTEGKCQHNVICVSGKQFQQCWHFVDIHVVPGLGSIHFFQFNSIPIQAGFRIFQFNSIPIQIRFRIFQFNSNSIHFLSIPIQFNSNFMHRNKQINPITGHFKFNLNISLFASQFRKFKIQDLRTAESISQHWFRYWANGLVPIRQQAVTRNCFIHVVLAADELMC